MHSVSNGMLISTDTQASQYLANLALIRRIKNKVSEYWSQMKMRISCSLEESLKYKFYLILSVNLRQCDQVDRLFIQFSDIYNNESLPNSLKIARAVSKFCQTISKPLLKLPKAFKIKTKWRNFAHSGHTDWKTR